jgi:ABC-type polysaccharide/polyol phosphate export permease
MAVASISPIITIIMPIIVLNRFFSLETEFGPWNSSNYIIFIFIGYNIMLMRRIIPRITHQLTLEKYWKTIPALITAPFNRFYLLAGYILSELFVVSFAFITLFIIAFILYPISFITLTVIMFMFFSITLIFVGISLSIGIFALSNEGIMAILNFIISLIFWASCITYPFELFPPQIQNIIRLNPIYYFIDVIRLTWIGDNIFLTLPSYPFHFLIFGISLVAFPIAGVFIFNRIYQKYGVSS